MSSLLSQELLDVVDARDNVIGARTRGEIHRLGLMHRSVHILVFNSCAELFLQKRSMNKDHNPGLWDSSAAGHVNSGEDYASCAARELGEELGIVVTSPVEFLFRLPATEITAMEHCSVYRYFDEGPFELQREEVEEGAWVSIAGINQRVEEQDPKLTGIFQFIWERLRLDDADSSTV